MFDWLNMIHGIWKSFVLSSIISFSLFAVLEYTPFLRYKNKELVIKRFYILFFAVFAISISFYAVDSTEYHDNIYGSIFESEYHEATFIGYIFDPEMKDGSAKMGEAYVTIERAVEDGLEWKYLEVFTLKNGKTMNFYSIWNTDWDFNKSWTFYCQDDDTEYEIIVTDEQVDI